MRNVEEEVLRIIGMKRDWIVEVQHRSDVWRAIRSARWGLSCR